MGLPEEHSRETSVQAGLDWPSRLLEGLWLIAAVAVPLAINPWGSNAFELPKAVLLRLLVLLMVLAALTRLISNPGTGRRGSGFKAWRAHAPWLVPALLFGLVLALATVYSIAPGTSLWGSHDRQQGSLTLGAYLVLFSLTAANLRGREQMERLWLALVWGSAPVVVYGLLQAAGFDPLDWHTDAASPVLSTLGRANFVGSYLVLVLPLTAGRLILARRRWPYLLLLGGQLACLALTQARAAWLGLAVALVTGLLAWAVASGWRKKHLAALLATALILGMLAIGFVALLNSPASPLAPLARLTGLDRLASLADTEAGSSAARLTTWRATLPLVVEGGALGYGPETMRPVFARVFPPELIYYQGRHVSVDRAHNLWLDLGMSAGLAGLAGLLAFLVGWAWLVWRGRPERRDRWRLVIWAGLVAGVVGHLVELQFSFDLTASATVFWLVLAMGAALWTLQPQGDRAATGLDRTGLEAPVLGTELDRNLPSAACSRQCGNHDHSARIPLGGIGRSVTPAEAGVHKFAGDLDSRLSGCVKTRENPLLWVARDEKCPKSSHDPSKTSVLGIKWGACPFRRRELDFSHSLLCGNDSDKLTVGRFLPRRIRPWRIGTRELLHLMPAVVLVLVLAWLVCARPLLADTAYKRTQEAGSTPEDRLAASARAVRMWPLEPVYRLELAWNQLQQGDARAAEGQLAAALEGNAHDPAVWAATGGLYARWGEVEPRRFVQAEAAYRRALELAPNTASFHVALGLVLARQGRLEEAVSELERAVALDSTDFVAYRHLADLYSAAGQEAKAIEAQWQAERWERETMTD